MSDQLTTEASRCAVLDAARVLGVHALPHARLANEGLASLALALGRDDADVRRTVIQEAARRMIAVRERDEVLRTLAARDVRVVAWKGLALEWGGLPRPVGDLDLLLEAHELERAVTALLERGYRRAPEAAAGFVRRGPTGVELLPPPDRAVGVDLHARVFRSVGHRIRVDALLARARDGALDPVDHAHLVLVHAAKHALGAIKWQLDVVALTAALTVEERAMLHARARATRTERPVALALWGATRTILPSWASTPARYALELVLEPGLRARARMLAGIVERWLV